VFELSTFEGTFNIPWYMVYQGMGIWVYPYDTCMYNYTYFE